MSMFLYHLFGVLQSGCHAADSYSMKSDHHCQYGLAVNVQSACVKCDWLNALTKRTIKISQSFGGFYFFKRTNTKSAEN